MTIRDDLKLAFNPKMLADVKEPNLAKGLKPMIYFFFVWLVIHIIIALINGVIDGQSLGGVFLFSMLIGVSVAIMGLVGLLVLGFVSTYTSKLFGGVGNLQKTLGLISVGVLPIVAIAIIREIILLVSALGGHFLADSFIYINLALVGISFVWLAWLLTEAIALANGIKKFSAFVCFVVGFVLASLANWPINWIFVKLINSIITGAL